MGSQAFSAMGAVSPMLLVFAICRSPETLRAQVKRLGTIINQQGNTDLQFQYHTNIPRQ